MYLDFYATAYLIALCAATASTFLGGDNQKCDLRLMCLVVMWAAWISTMTITAALGSLAPVAWFAGIDFVAVLFFCWIAIHSSRWVWALAGLHALAIGAHAVFVADGQTERFVYLSVLAGINYICLALIEPRAHGLIMAGVHYGRSAVDRSLGYLHGRSSGA